MKVKINIIDPSSTEFNRGSFCYAPYLVYNGLSALSDTKITLLETFIPENLDCIPEADINIVCLWSYPQIETAQMLAQLLPYQTGKDNVYFVGYSPLIDHLGLRHLHELMGIDPLQNGDFLKIAMMAYPKNYRLFERLLLSDCDMHLKELETNDLVYPLFTSYGCPNGCSFCPSTENCGRMRVALEVPEVLKLFDQCKEVGIKCIHLTDEDFFFDIRRAYTILSCLADSGFRMIALGSASRVRKFIDVYTAEPIRKAGLEIIEIGFESGDENIATSMGAGKSLDDCAILAQNQPELPFSIFWLVLTFFPGETLRSLNRTGQFMMQYGHDESEVVGRLRTNGTKGGLGQFFQPYHGLDLFEDLEEEGIFLTNRPVRLIPSYLPDSFLDSIVTSSIASFDESEIAIAEPWLALYNTSIPGCLQVGMTVRECIEGRKPQEQIKNALAIAILARLGLIS